MSKILRLVLALSFILLFASGQALAWDPIGQVWVKTVVAAGDTNDDSSLNGVNRPTVSDADYQTTAFDTVVTAYSGDGNRMDGMPQRMTIYVITSAVSSGASVQVTLQDSPDNTNWSTLLALTNISATGTQVYRTGAQSTDIPESFGRYLRVSFTLCDGDSTFDERASFTVKAVFRAG